MRRAVLQSCVGFSKSKQLIFSMLSTPSLYVITSFVFAANRVYASLFRVQLHSCSVLGAQSFKPHRDEESFGALPQLGDSISTRGGDEERLEGLRPGDVEMFFGPSHNLSSAASAATDSVQEEEGSSGDDGAASMMLSVRKEQQQLERGEARGDVGEGTSCDFLNGVLSTVSRREMVAVLAPFGLTIRRFQLLLDR